MRLRSLHASPQNVYSTTIPYESPERPRRRIVGQIVTMAIVLLLLAFFGGRYLKRIWKIDSIGIVRATTLEVSAPVAGRLLELRVREGDRVRPGDLVARLEDPALEADRRAADALIEASIERIALAEQRQVASPVSPRDFATAEAQVDADEAALRKARTEEETAFRLLALVEERRRRIEDLVLYKAATRSELDEAVHREETARGAATAAARETERLLTKRSQSDRILAAMRETASGPLFAESIRGREAEIAEAKRVWREAEDARRRLDVRLSLLEIRAARSGIVCEPPRHPGENLQAGETIARLSDPTDVWVELFVRSDRSAAVFEGTKVDLQGPASGTRRGVVENFFPEIDVLPLSVRNLDRPQDRFVRARVRLRGGNAAGLTPGQVLKASILRAER